MNAAARPRPPYDYASLDFRLEISKGNIEGHQTVNKFGAAALSTSLDPVTSINAWRTPSTPEALEFVSSSIADTAAGAGAREVTMMGINDLWQEETVSITTNGTTPVPLPGTWHRVNRLFIQDSGSYGEFDAGGVRSHVGNLDILEPSPSSKLWGRINNAIYPNGQSEIGCYCGEIGYTYLLTEFEFFISQGDNINFFLVFRERCDQIAAPFSGVRSSSVNLGQAGVFSKKYGLPVGPFVGPCDIGFLASAAVTAIVGVQFQLVKIENSILENL